MTGALSWAIPLEAHLMLSLFLKDIIQATTAKKLTTAILPDKQDRTPLQQRLGQHAGGHMPPIVVQASP